MEFKVGDKLCDCTLIEFCGSGAYGEVWLAEDAIGTRIALKIIRNRNSYSERELNGLKNYKDCNHPNLLKIRSVKITDDAIYYTMDAADDLNCGRGKYLPDTLANRLHKFGRLDGREITKMLDGLLAGLEELHKKGLVHRDIKPDNIIWVNGRATLADVGLIANDGANSLVGTPGFLSPRVLNGKPAEASDDFYALGKVIYCALTGLAVTEYPSLPTNVTISMDANLNRALREGCSSEIHSTAEFRELLSDKKTSKKTKIPLKKILQVLIAAAVIGSLFYLFFEQNKIKTEYTEQVIERDAASERRLEKLQSVPEDFKADLQKKVLKIFQDSKWLDDDKLFPFLLEYEIMTAEVMRELILSGSGNPRLVPTSGAYRKTSRISSELETGLSVMLHGGHYPDFDKKQVRERQQYWRNKGNLKTMLTTDTLMQAIALDAIIRHGINTILGRGSFAQNDETNLKELIDLRHALLDTKWGELQYISKNF